MRIKILVALVALLAGAPTTEAVSEPSDSLATPESFASIADPAARSAAMFVELGKVLTNPRCVNCHPAGDRPQQGEQGRLHQPRWSAVPMVMGCRPCAARSATNRLTSIPPACRAIPNGTSHRATWRGKARRSARSALRSRTLRVTAADHWNSSCITSAPTLWLAGLGRPALAASLLPAPSRKRARSLKHG
jgi:hypothetical protein